MGSEVRAASGDSLGVERAQSRRTMIPSKPWRSREVVAAGMRSARSGLANKRRRPCRLGWPSATTLELSVRHRHRTCYLS